MLFEQDLQMGFDLPLAGGFALWLFKVRPDGSELTQISRNSSGEAYRQAWSPDSQKIAYVQGKEYGGRGDLWVAQADGSGDQMIFEGVGKGYALVA
jgi:Tol biopolymer transport system component